MLATKKQHFLVLYTYNGRSTKERKQKITFSLFVEHRLDK